MTYTIFELHEVKCDRCKKTETTQFNSEFEDDPIGRQNDFIKDLQDKGWIYNGKQETHYCPKCQVKVKVK